ncbi:hypothetical protein BC829DRAFT_38414 [Chytridium lagenaria]|nr:hypothetical protein BC829DRAFT_38414 [Chytridium lagenaria]
MIRTSGEIRLSDFLLWQGSQHCHIHYVVRFGRNFRFGTHYLRCMIIKVIIGLRRRGDGRRWRRGGEGRRWGRKGGEDVRRMHWVWIRRERMKRWRSL